MIKAPCFHLHKLCQTSAYMGLASITGILSTQLISRNISTKFSQHCVLLSLVPCNRVECSMTLSYQHSNVCTQQPQPQQRRMQRLWLGVGGCRGSGNRSLKSPADSRGRAPGRWLGGKAPNLGSGGGAPRSLI